VRVYRAALDYLGSLPSGVWANPEKILLPDEFTQEIERTGTRSTTKNFITERPGSNEMNYSFSRAEQAYEPVAVIRKPGKTPLVEMRNTTFIDENIEYMKPSIGSIKVRITQMVDEEGNEKEKAHPGNRLFLQTKPDLGTGLVNGILRRKKGIPIK
jgi:hypothetical protein